MHPIMRWKRYAAHWLWRTHVCRTRSSLARLAPDMWVLMTGRHFTIIYKIKMHDCTLVNFLFLEAQRFNLNVIPSLLHKNHSSIFTILNFVLLVLLPKLANKYLKSIFIALRRFTSAKLLPVSYMEMYVKCAENEMFASLDLNKSDNFNKFNNLTADLTTSIAVLLWMFLSAVLFNHQPMIVKLVFQS